MAQYSAGKAQELPNPDPARALSEGWHRHVAFGLANPDIFAILTVQPRVSYAPQRGLAILRDRVRALALAGRLNTGETAQSRSCISWPPALSLSGAEERGQRSPSDHRFSRRRLPRHRKRQRRHHRGNLAAIPIENGRSWHRCDRRFCQGRHKADRIRRTELF